MAFTNQVSNYGSYKYVVSATAPGPYKTIQAAIDEAVAQGDTTTIFVRPGSYTENLTLYTGVDIQGSEEGQVTITGVHVPPAAGTFAISNCKLVSATHAFSSAVAGTTVISVKNCLFTLTAGYVFNMAAWTGDLSIANCTDTSVANGIITNGSGSALNIVDSSIGAGATAMAVVGVTTIYNSRIFCPIALTGNANVSIDGGSVIDGAITLANPAILGVYNSRIVSGASACITTTSAGLTTLENVVLDSAAASVIAGTGVIELGEVVFNNVSVIAGTITYAHASLVGIGNLNIENILFLNSSAGSAGQVLTSNGVAAPTWQAAGGGGMTWSIITADTALVNNNGYINKNATPANLTLCALPGAAVAGAVYAIQGYTSGLWKITQGANQQIYFGNQKTTVGATGYLLATNQYDSVYLVCITANLEFVVLQAVGNITVF